MDASGAFFQRGSPMEANQVIMLLVISIALYTDLRKRIIPNWLTFGGAGIGILIHIYETGWTGMGVAASGFFLGIAFLIIPFMMGGIGAGDVKLMGAIGALMGIHFVFYTMLWTAIAGGVISVIYIMIKRGWFSWNIYSAKGLVFPYGVAIFIGAALEWIRTSYPF